MPRLFEKNQSLEDAYQLVFLWNLNDYQSCHPQ